MCKPVNRPRVDFVLPRYVCHATLFFYAVPSYVLMIVIAQMPPSNMRAECISNWPF